jgi:hypothetical protein
MGRDGRIMAINWGDGKGPANFTTETKYIPLPQAPSPNELKLSLAPVTSRSPQATVGTPISSVPVGLGHDPGGNFAVGKTDSHGGFAFTKVGAGTLSLNVSTKDIVVGAGAGGGPHKAEAVLIGLLLPSVGTGKASYIEHAFTGDSLGRDIKVSFRVGKDGRIMSLDWNNGSGPIDPEKEARNLPLPQGAQPGEIRGMMTIFDRCGY